MYKTIYPRHVQKHGYQMTYILSIAGEKVRGGAYPTPSIAALEAELVKRYVRARYGTKVAAMRAAVPEADLQAYAAERGYNLSYPGILQFLPRHIREMFAERGDEIGRNFAELEPRPLREILVAEGRKERQQMKLERIAAQTAASAKRAEIWLKAQQEAAQAWKNAKIELEGLRKDETFVVGPTETALREVLAESIRKEFKRTPIGGVEATREQALEGLGDPSTWKAESEALYAQFRKKLDSVCPLCQKFPCDGENHLHG